MFLVYHFFFSYSTMKSVPLFIIKSFEKTCFFEANSKVICNCVLKLTIFGSRREDLVRIRLFRKNMFFQNNRKRRKFHFIPLSLERVCGQALLAILHSLFTIKSFEKTCFLENCILSKIINFGLVKL